ncbi:MAG: hypothetical protein ACO1NZ_07175 [Adhaeribacter sp.]
MGYTHQGNQMICVPANIKENFKKFKKTGLNRRIPGSSSACYLKPGFSPEMGVLWKGNGNFIERKGELS